MTHPFFCHYTGKDGRSPRRRLQQLTFFDHVPAIGNSTSSPTPLWVEVIKQKRNGLPFYIYMLHAQLSDTVAVYVEYKEDDLSLAVQRVYAKGGLQSAPLPLRNICQDGINNLITLTDFTSYLLSHPCCITPPILAAYKEARPEEYNQLKSLSNY